MVDTRSRVSIDLVAFNATASWFDMDFKKVNVMVISEKRHERQRIRDGRNNTHDLQFRVVFLLGSATVSS